VLEALLAGLIDTKLFGRIHWLLLILVDPVAKDCRRLSQLQSGGSGVSH
jgi:hypothetical protein